MESGASKSSSTSSELSRRIFRGFTSIGEGEKERVSSTTKRKGIEMCKKKKQERNQKDKEKNQTRRRGAVVKKLNEVSK